mmetsp:Transcript_29685/g.53877  ORF Transcript_29685/g.53877 Transcript_29685/m.53877 type:complete len:887 (-) Transcript_29685:86-2746(-)|eukprot:CAMPEP_0201869078 /NCGR_PEP_ID=MMETSP0902-20130614/2727_1 /ASSEMBLY_ACC=CAM_ASM_000551 /TAXON_ID=420261 /ORGANISM="Thalassiosira antarctica, Strain CCMP982" /LENGTH=886 /DNA_ID=CAMNT_0048394519 /DNA_START=104 /DNA_END=2764 /DNA_ORIENTATION=-
MASSKTEGRVLLPPTINPIRYDLKFTPDLENFTFSGETTIEVTTSADVGNDITMHAKELCFATASYVVKGESGEEVHEVEEIRVNMKATTVTFVFGGVLPANATLILKIEYTGFLNNQMAGFYRSSYTDIHGESKIMASTQFESLDARRAFPCWDEPARKAIFGVTLTVPKHMDVFSNMPELSNKTLAGGTKKELAFLDTPIMSTYLVAFCVGEFDYVQAQTSHGVLVRVYTPPGKSDAGAFALDCATKSLDAYDDFFGIPYPLPKLDMVAIPEFAAGAMENWGLVTYREVDLLIDPTKASTNQKQRVCTVVTHELAHQWFGNLVTMTWWDDLWLNEGFASWAENWAADVIFPHWSMWDQFTTGHLSAAMRLDALKSSHPIQVPIRHAEEVEEVFDAISYCKGGSVVKMARAVLGMKAFQKGLGNYMKKHAYGNTETFDLWKAWEESSGMPVQEMMASWTSTMGFPLVTVTGEKWESDKVTLTLEQEWFLSDGSPLSEEDKKKKWCIPLLTCTAEGTQKDMIFMREKTATVTIPLPSKDGWVKLNAGQDVPMRVKLTSDMIDRLGEGIKSKTLPPADRAALLTDSYALVKAGKMRPEALIKLLSNYTDEDSYIVWCGIAEILGGLDTVMSDDPAMSKNFKSLAKNIVIGLYNKVGWEAKSTDGHLDVLLRGMMIGLLGNFCYDDNAVATEASRRFALFQQNHDDMKSLPSDMRSSVFSIVLKNGGAQEYQEVKAYFTATTDNAERKHVLGSLGHTSDLKLKQSTLEWAISGEIKLQDFFYPMGSVRSSSLEGRNIAWVFYKNNFKAIKAMIGNANSSLMDAAIVSCGGGFCSNEKANEIEEFFKANPVPRSTRKIQQTLENMRANANFLALLQSSDLAKDVFWSSL